MIPPRNPTAGKQSWAREQYGHEDRRTNQLTRANSFESPPVCELDMVSALLFFRNGNRLVPGARFQASAVESDPMLGVVRIQYAILAARGDRTHGAGPYAEALRRLWFDSCRYTIQKAKLKQPIRVSDHMQCRMRQAVSVPDCRESETSLGNRRGNRRSVLDEARSRWRQRN
jgi:hypothetical protein